jgi:hypothetical protein
VRSSRHVDRLPRIRCRPVHRSQASRLASTLDPYLPGAPGKPLPGRLDGLPQAGIRRAVIGAIDELRAEQRVIGLHGRLERGLQRGGRRRERIGLGKRLCGAQMLAERVGPDPAIVGGARPIDVRRPGRRPRNVLAPAGMRRRGPGNEREARPRKRNDFAHIRAERRRAHERPDGSI